MFDDGLATFWEMVEHHPVNSSTCSSSLLQHHAQDFKAPCVIEHPDNISFSRVLLRNFVVPGQPGKHSIQLAENVSATMNIFSQC